MDEEYSILIPSASSMVNTQYCLPAIHINYRTIPFNNIQGDGWGITIALMLFRQKQK